MKKVILHVGTHKTGTSAIQQFLSKNRRILPAQGFHYPLVHGKFGRVVRTRNAHFLVMYARAVIKGEQLSEDDTSTILTSLKKLSDLAETGDTIILSDERLWAEGGHYVELWPFIKDVLEEAGIECIEIVVYLRRQDEFIASLWNQSVKSQVRTTASLQEYSEISKKQKYMDYDARLRELEAVFGKEHITVRVYERDRLKDRDVRFDFCDLVGIKVDDSFVIDKSNVNSGLNSNLVEIKRQANLTGSYCETNNFLNKPLKAVSALRKQKDSRLLYPPEWYKNLLATYAEGNARIARDYLNDESGMLFNLKELESTETWSMNDASFTEDMIRLFMETISREHIKRLEAEQRIEQLEAQVESLSADVSRLVRLQSEPLTKKLLRKIMKRDSPVS